MIRGVMRRAPFTHRFWIALRPARAWRAMVSRVRPTRCVCAAILAMAACAAAPVPAGAQDLFEIQVYPYDTVEPGHTMLEFHTNFIPSGTTDTSDGLFANHHQVHLTAEITHGWTRRFETGFYIETAPYVPGKGARFVGWHVRPRFSFPEAERFPFHVSLSFEYAFNQPGFDPNGQTLEIRPIFERQKGRLYLSINPDMSLAVKGPDAGTAPAFEPEAKAGWDVTRKVAAGVEYYAETGTVRHFEPRSEQHHILFPAIDLNLSPDWEFNVGVGRGLTGATEHWIVKSIVGYRFKR
jgi:outer membrane putative beta-barrel porin/alpha-amylase